MGVATFCDSDAVETLMTPLEIILEQQRRLLASIESIESVVRAGRLTECRGLIADFESDLGSAIDAPILPHLQSRLALLHARVGSLEAAASEASAAPAGIVGGTYDPLVEYRGRLGKAAGPRQSHVRPRMLSGLAGSRAVQRRAAAMLV